MLAVPWAIVKCRLFLARLPHFKIITDHHPPVHNLNKNRLDEIKNLMLQRLKTRIMGYCFTAKWINGTPDALSCSPVSDPTPSESLAEQELDNGDVITCAEICVIHGPEVDSTRIQELRQQAA